MNCCILARHDETRAGHCTVFAFAIIRTTDSVEFIIVDGTESAVKVEQVRETINVMIILLSRK